MVLRKSATLLPKLLATGVLFATLTSMVQADTIRFWTTEEQPERLAKQQAMADSFKAETGHTVEVIPVTEKDLGTRAGCVHIRGKR